MGNYRNHPHPRGALAAGTTGGCPVARGASRPVAMSESVHMVSFPTLVVTVASMFGMNDTAQDISAARRPMAPRAWWPGRARSCGGRLGSPGVRSATADVQARLHLTATTVQATFGLYVAGLIPGLLLGPISDRPATPITSGSSRSR